MLLNEIWYVVVGYMEVPDAIQYAHTIAPIRRALQEHAVWNPNFTKIESYTFHHGKLVYCNFQASLPLEKFAYVQSRIGMCICFQKDDIFIYTFHPYHKTKVISVDKELACIKKIQL